MGKLLILLHRPDPRSKPDSPDQEKFCPAGTERLREFTFSSGNLGQVHKSPDRCTEAGVCRSWTFLKPEQILDLGTGLRKTDTVCYKVRESHDFCILLQVIVIVIKCLEGREG
jgi:hypothetical protein